jgi:glycosyltransferase involved in cell wall biosynthesis
LAKQFISVLIDTYNHEQFIEQAIVSVLEQDFPAADREIIVVDDGSTDRTPDIVRKFEPRVRLLRKANGGQASAFNAGIPECRGKIVSFLDGDDWWAPAKLRRAAEVLETYPEVGAVGHGQYEFYPDGRPLGVVVAEKRFRVHLKDPDSARLFTYLRWCLGTSKITIRRPLLERCLPIPKELAIEADEWIFTLAPALAPAVVLDEPLFYYRLHGGNLFQYSKQDEAKARRKGAVLAALLRDFPPKLRELNVSSEFIAMVTEPIWVDAERIKLSLDGGRPWQTFQVERAGYRYSHSGASFGYRIFNALVLGMTVVLPPRLFYRLRQWYSDRNLGRLRRFVGEPVAAAPILERRPPV